MGAKVKGFWEKAKTLFLKIPRKIIIISAAVLAVVVIAAVVVINSRPYAVLVTDVSNDEAAAIMGILDEQGVTDYRLENGNTIMVREGQAVQLKAKLLAQGYPKTGFSYSPDEYYNKVGTFATAAEQRTAYLLWLSEKLSAVIRCFDGVRDATVDLNEGEDRSYVLDSGNVIEASASVAVDMREGEMLTADQASAIRNYVARAVKGLNVTNVTITDMAGNQYNDTELSSTSDLSALKLQLEQENNNKIRMEVLNVLAPLFGSDNVKVSVNCTVDVNRTVEDITTYTPPEGSVEGSGTGLLGSEVYDHSIVLGEGGAASGVPGTKNNSDLSQYVETYTPDGSEQELHTSGQNDYVTDSHVTRVERVAGYITDCMISVSVNSTTAGSVDVDALTTHIARAAGIADDAASAKISVLPWAFYDPEAPLPVDPGVPVVERWVIYAAAGGLAAFLLILFIVLIIRKKRKKRRLAHERNAVDEMLASIRIPEPETAGLDVMSLNTEKSMELRKDIRKFADENPEIAAQIIRSMLRGAEGNG